LPSEGKGGEDRRTGKKIKETGGDDHYLQKSRGDKNVGVG